ncbi:Zinc finger, RING-type [Sesbania bispinosa]|nr:Zinc finger, RING-type [Sesbania bispinosa]
MEYESYSRFSILPLEGFSPHFLSQEESPLWVCDYFYINFHCHRHTNHSPRQTHSTHNEIAAPITTFDQSYLIPRDIISDFGVIDPIFYLRELFHSVPVSSELMDSILPSLVARAKGMIEHNNEGRHMLAMTVILCSTTWPRHSADEEGIDHFIDDLMKSLEYKFDDTDDSCSELCAICLEGLGTSGSQSKVVRTKCLHMFHEKCISQWLLSCNTNNQSCSCPLCRCQIAS